jgi:hypothetical protein
LGGTKYEKKKLYKALTGCGKAWSSHYITKRNALVYVAQHALYNGGPRIGETLRDIRSIQGGDVYAEKM